MILLRLHDRPGPFVGIVPQLMNGKPSVMVAIFVEMVRFAKA